MSIARARGMGLVDVIVGIALMLLVFTALFGVLQASLALSSLTKVRAGALELASSQMEYLRQKSYATLGTVGGTPSGSIAAATTTVLNGIPYNLQTSITYRDDPADGIGPSDENAVTADYKVGKVTVSYFANGTTTSLTLVSNFVPSGIETNP